MGSSQIVALQITLSQHQMTKVYSFVWSIQTKKSVCICYCSNEYSKIIFNVYILAWGNLVAHIGVEISACTGVRTDQGGPPGGAPEIPVT